MMLQEWIRIQLTDHEVHIGLLGTSINISKWYVNGEVKPVEVRWASLYESSLENAKQFQAWLVLAIELADQLDRSIVQPEDFKRLQIRRTKLSRLAIIDRGAIFIMVPNELQLEER